MAKDSMKIEIAAESPEELGRILEAKVTDSNGEPVQGAEVTITIEGDGTLMSGLHVTKQVGTSNDQGQLLAIWYEYPRYVPRRNLSSVVNATCNLPNCNIKLNDLNKLYGIRVEYLDT